MWMTAVLLAASLVVYALVRRRSDEWDAGGPVALGFAVAATGIFVFEMLLGLRKARPAWQLGGASSWARAHVWLGTLALALSLLHAGFRVRGTMSVVLTSLLGCVTLSGVVGLTIHQVVPRWMTARIPRETIYEQIPVVLGELRKEAAELVTKADDDVLSRFYREDIESFLASSSAGRHRLLEPERAARVFDRIEKRVRPECHDALRDLRDICDERAQLFLQQRMQAWLHGWLLVHVPLSYALIVLVAAHALMTLRY
jgi:hypothetical protein